MEEKKRVEDTIMEMLEPKVKEIQKRFSEGEKLSFQDFNLLLLKTQYNPLNHLDEKLDQTDADVANLKIDFANLRGEFAGLKGELKAEFAGLRGDFKALEQNIEAKIQKTIVMNMKWTIGSIAFLVTILKLLELIFQ
ncbi:MAG: hypothetical protein HY738_04525 [Bacteroidia bacterium]|nr:hypothetical protein [Bacteroidia bacterium]